MPHSDHSSSSSQSGESIGGDGLFQSDELLIIALDFGTTFSGIAYAFQNVKRPEVISIMDWPGLEGHPQPKVPTVISYNPTDREKFTWGAQKHGSEVVQGVKLLLDPNQPRPFYLPESTAKTDLKKLGKPAVDVAADFMRAMYEHAMSKIKSKYPIQYLETCQQEFVLTVPAVWSDKAKDTTLKAAKLAGIYPVTVVKEPQAAATYTLHKLQDMSLAVGDAFVICDAGGGTVDLISYEITQLTPKLELKELVPGKGGMAGSLGLNQRFEAAVKDLVGEDQYFHLRKTKGFEQARVQFDRLVKRAFRDDPDEEWFINFPMANLADDPEKNLMSRTWNIQSDDVKEIFDPLIDDIKRLVDEQVNLVQKKRISESHPKADEIKAIFLVGGFGSSEYLKRRLEEEHSDIQIIQPPEAWSAIVKGAVLSKLPQEASILSTQATRHYGVRASSVYDAFIDRGQKKKWDPVYGKFRATRMTWYINIGDDLKRDQKIKFPFFRTLDEDFEDHELIFMSDLIQSENKLPPVHPASSTTKVNCVVTSDLRNVDRKHFEKVDGEDGKTYVKVNFDLVITIQTAVMKFSLEIKGKEMGSVNANYD